MSLTSPVKMRGATTVCVLLLVGAVYSRPRVAREAFSPVPSEKENGDPKLARPLPVPVPADPLLPPAPTPASFSGLPLVGPNGPLPFPVPGSPVQGSAFPGPTPSPVSDKNSEIDKKIGGEKGEAASSRLPSAGPVGQMGPFGPFGQSGPVGQMGPMGQMGQMGQMELIMRAQGNPAGTPMQFKDGASVGQGGPAMLPFGPMSSLGSKTSNGQMPPFRQMAPMGQMPPFGPMPPMGQMPPFGPMPPMGQMPPFRQMPPTGQLPSNGQMPSNGQLSSNGQMPPMGQMPQFEQLPPFGEMAPNGQRPPNGQMPPFGQMAPNGQRPPNGQMPPFGQMAPNGQMLPFGQLPPMGQLGMMNSIQQTEQTLPLTTTFEPEAAGSASENDVTKDTAASGQRPSLQAFLARENAGVAPSQYDPPVASVPSFGLPQARPAGSGPTGGSADGAQPLVPPELQLLIAQARMQGIPPQLLAQQLQLQRMAASQMPVMPSPTQMPGQNPFMQGMPSQSQQPGQNPLMPGMQSPSQLPGQNPFMPGIQSASQLPGQNPFMPGMQSPSQLPGQNPFMPGMQSPSQLPGQNPFMPGMQSPSQLPGQNPFMPGMPQQERGMSPELLRLQGMPPQMEQMGMLGQSPSTQLPPFMPGMGLPTQDIPTEKPAVDESSAPQPLGLKILSQILAQAQDPSQNFTAKKDQESILPSLVPGPVSLPMSSLQDMMAFEEKMQSARMKLLKSFYTDVAAYQTLGQYIQQRMVVKLALLHLIETRMAMPMRGSIAMALTSSLPTGAKSG